MNIPTTRSLLTRLALIAIWAVLFFMPTASAIDLPAIRSLGTLLSVISLVTGAAAIIARRYFRMPSPVHLALAGFVLWSGLTLAWSIAPQLTIERTTTDLRLFALVMLIWQFSEHEKDVIRMLTAFVAGTIAPALVTFAAAGKNAPQTGHPTELAMLMAVSLPVSYYLNLRRDGWIKWIYRIQMSLSVSLIVWSGGYGAMFAMVVGLSVMLWTLNTLPFQSRINVVAVLLVMLTSLVFFIPAEFWYRFGEAGDTTLASITTTISRSFHESPVGGFGAGAHSFAPHFIAAGNSYLAVIVETGIVGIGCLLAALILVVVAADETSGINRAFWFTFLGAWAVGICSANWESGPAAWLLFGLLTAHTCCRERLAAATRNPVLQSGGYFEPNAEVLS